MWDFSGGGLTGQCEWSVMAEVDWMGWARRPRAPAVEVGPFQTDARAFLGEVVSVTVDRPLGSRHPRHGYVYPLNYGYVPDTRSADGHETDAYVLGVFEPVAQFVGVCIAIIRRHDDVEDKLIVAPPGRQFSDEQIAALTEFQERYFTVSVIRPSRASGGAETLESDLDSPRPDQEDQRP